MDKDEIKMALRETVEALKNEKGYDGVWVPKRSKTQPCSWKQGRAKAERKVFLPFAEMLDVVNFALDNTFVKMPDGRILKQNQGIPMGDPTSPGITIVTCARLESKFIKEIPEEEKKNFCAKRYMDDLLVITTNTDNKHQAEMLGRLDSDCYGNLKLVPGRENTFLETILSRQQYERTSKRQQYSRLVAQR